MSEQPLLDDGQPIPPSIANDASVVSTQESGVGEALTLSENLNDKYDYEFPEWYALKAEYDQEQGIVINPEIAQALQSEAQELLTQGLTGNEIADKLGRSIVFEQRSDTIRYLVRKDLPDQDKPLEKPAPEWDPDEYFTTKCAVIAGLQPELKARNQEYKDLTENLLESDLSYRDVLGDEAKRAGSESEYPEHATAYAHELVQLMLSGRGSELIEAAEDIRQRFDSLRHLLPETVELSPYAKSKSWILWDIGKQEVLKDKEYPSTIYPNTNYSGSVFADPADKNSSSHASFMRNTIAERHLGWELHHKAFNGEDMNWLDSFLDEQTRGLLHKVGDESHHGQLASSEYADLGQGITRALYKKFRHDHPPTDEDRAHSNEILATLRPTEPLTPLKNKPTWFDSE